VPTDAVSVTLGVGAAPYQKTLASALLKQGMLRRVLDLGLYLDIQEPDGPARLKSIRRHPGYRFFIRAVWAIWRRLPKAVRPGQPILLNVWLADRILANWITPCTIFHGMTAICFASLRAANRQGAITVLETGSRHPRYWQQAAIEERRRFGVDERNGGQVFSERVLRRMEHEYHLCDKFTVLSSAALRSFQEFGYGHKAVVILPGIDHTFFTPPVVPKPSPLFRLCYVGRVELAKGLGYLLQAWKRLALPHAELFLIGEVQPDIKSILQEFAGATIKVTGFQFPPHVAQHYRESSVFVFPSVNEGFGVVLLEAMASGLPVIAAEGTGADECVKNGEEGLIVPARSVEALADAILWFYKNPEETRAMGAAARARIESQFTLDHYNQRVISLYKHLAAEPKRSPSPEP
jgi:glycosyltransferase involved in cell wall biosynthesis